MSISDLFFCEYQQYMSGGFLLAFRTSLGHAITFFVNISDFDLECDKLHCHF